MVVHVPDDSYYAPGITFVLASDVFSKKPDPSNHKCTPPNCIFLPSLRNVTGEYTVTEDASRAVGYPLREGSSIPVRAAYELIGPDIVVPDTQPPPSYPDLPLDKTFVSSTVVDIAGVSKVQFAWPFPPGLYARALFPEPPFDQYFPPVFYGSLSRDVGNLATLIRVSEHIDHFELGGAKTPLDDTAENGSRTANVSREDGLTGFRVWLADQKTKRRISVIKVLSGKEDSVRLDTSGENNHLNGGLGDDVEAIVAPPEDYTAVPRLVTPLFHGAGLKRLAYPTIPPPVAVTGVVAEPSVEGQTTLLGYPATLSFDSETLATRGDPTPLLHYSTTVATDDRGRFATLLPPGTYRATIEPAVGTAFAKTSQLVVVAQAPTAFTLRPPLRTVVTGRAVLTDERPLSEAEVIAFPQDPTNPESPKPRPNRTRTLADGRFSMELDPGPYLVTVIPKAGTGFPWVVSRSEIPVQATVLPDLRVPAPTTLTFTLHDPGLVNPIVRAVVRILAHPAADPSSSKLVEIGSAMTDSTGKVEILLAQEPR